MGFLVASVLLLSEDRRAIAPCFWLAFSTMRLLLLICCSLLIGLSITPVVTAIGRATAVDIRVVMFHGRGAARESAAKRLAWALRQRTSVETVLDSTPVRFDDPSLFDTPLVYWSGDEGFPPLSEPEIVGLRRFVEFGGFVLIDDAAPESEGFDTSVRRTLGRAFGVNALQPLEDTHTIYRSFYLIDRPEGRVRGLAYLEAVQRGARAAVVYTRHDLGGAWARDNLGNYLYPVVPGGNTQREAAYRLGVNLVMYALCLDYKDDQVHSPFIMRRRAERP